MVEVPATYVKALAALLAALVALVFALVADVAELVAEAAAAAVEAAMVLISMSDVASPAPPAPLKIVILFPSFWLVLQASVQLLVQLRLLQ